MVDPVTLAVARRQLTRGYEGVAWLGDSLTANGSTPTSIVFTLDAGVSASATSVSLTNPYSIYPSPATPAAGTLLVFEPGTAREEHAVIPSGGVSGTGPYTVTVPALTYAHAAGSAVRTEARQWGALSVPMWTHLLSSGRLRFGGVFAHGGYTAAQMQTVYLPQVIAAKPAVCVICVGTNTTPTLTDIPTYIVPTWRALLAAGILPIIQTLPPKNTLVGANAYVATRFNARLIHEARKLGLPVYDVYAQLVDTGVGIAGSGGYLTTYNSDDTHPSEVGARVWAQGLVTLVNGIGLLRPVDPYVHSANTNTGDSTAYPGLASNSVMLTDTNSDGIPDNWAKSAGNAGDTCALSMVAGITGQAMTITRQVAGTTTAVYVSNSFTLTAGHRYRFTCKVQTSGVDAAYAAQISTTGGAGGNTTTTLTGWGVRLTNVAADHDVLFSIKTWKRDVAAVTTMVGDFVCPAGLSSTTTQVRVELGGSASTPAYSVTIGQPTIVDLTGIGATS